MGTAIAKNSIPKTSHPKTEMARCKASCAYFIINYVEILSAEEEKWIDFDLWPAQVGFVRQLVIENRLIMLKARQLGFTTICIGYLLWRFVFYPVAAIGLFSKGEMEAKEILSRFTSMYKRLPDWMVPEKAPGLTDNAHRFEISNGSWVQAFSTRQGESFTFGYIFLDEFCRFDDADTLLRNVKPAADTAGSQIIIGSIVDKEKLTSPFVNIFTDAWDNKGESEWVAVFLPWSARPGRDEAWYKKIMKETISQHGGDKSGALDQIYMQYPSTPKEALSPKMQNKRYPFAIVDKVYHEMPYKTGYEVGGPPVPRLKVYRMAQPGRKYVMGADPAEGLEGSDNSACRVIDLDSGEEVATFEGKHEPKKVFPKHLFDLAVWYNDARILVERNNHGHAVIAELSELIAKKKFCKVELLKDPADKRHGWLTSPTGKNVTRGKVAMHDTCYQEIADQLVTIHDEVTFKELLQIDATKLAADIGHDDCATAIALAITARTIIPRVVEDKVFF